MFAATSTLRIVTADVNSTRSSDTHISSTARPLLHDEKMMSLSSSNPYADLLEELGSLDIWSARKLTRELKEQNKTISGFPRIRPSDCSKAVAALRTAFEKNRESFRLQDKDLIQIFDELIEGLLESDIRFYAGQMFDLHILQTELRLLADDPQGAMRIISFYAERPYIVESTPKSIIHAMRLDGLARLKSGLTEGLGTIFRDRFWTIAQHIPNLTWSAFGSFSTFIALPSAGDRMNARDRFLSALARLYVKGRYFSVHPIYRFAIAPHIAMLVAQIAAQLQVKTLRISWGSLSLFQPKNRHETIVTRAQGGIGDLIMMTPGLRALAVKYGHPIKFVTNKKFFPIFSNNKNVELIDIEGPALSLLNTKWRNLTVCPAAQYESRVFPFVRRNRVRLFAGGMGVGFAALLKTGMAPEVPKSPEEDDFCTKFLRDNGLGKRPIVGVQPYSRDSYKDHPFISDIILELSKKYGVIIFHHIQDGLPSGEGIATTAGLPLGQSMALVSRLAVMVAVDSAFLHVPSAHNVPLVGLFGPTDGIVQTQHHRRKAILMEREQFPCMPCWRNEDTPCVLTGSTGRSPCVAAIKKQQVLDAVASFLL